MKDQIKTWLKTILTEKRYQRSLGSAQSAVDLAKKFGVDEEKAELAALLHDNAKCMSNEELLKIIEENNLPLLGMEEESFKTLHAPVSAFIAEKKWGIKDQDLLNSIRWQLC